MLTVPILEVQLNPLDLLLKGIGYRLSTLACGDDEKFLALIKDKTITLQFTSNDGVARFFSFDNGQFSQSLGKADDVNLTINFVDGTTGAKLLAKADTVALMQAVQDGKMSVEGDFKLILWFASLAKFIGKVPDQYAPYVEKLTPLWQSAKPYANQAGQIASRVLKKFKK